MTYVNDYNTVLPELLAIPKDNIWKPRAPVDIAAQEGENLYKWALKDKDILIANGLSWEVVETLPMRAGALRQAETNWMLVKSKEQDARRVWEEESPESFVNCGTFSFAPSALLLRMFQRHWSSCGK